MDVLEKSFCLIGEGEGAQKWQRFLHCPLNPDKPEEYFFSIYYSDFEVLVEDREGRKLEIDFDKNHLDYKRRGHKGKNELISKALGVSKGVKKVLDLSVGMGIDSIFMTQLGFEVEGVERSPVLYMLLSEALKRTNQENLKNYKLHFADSLEFLDSFSDERYHAIYFDPMYPHKKKSALPKQEMMVFRDLVGHDDDASLVLKKALTHKVKRVVIKRPMNAEELLPGVQHAYEGKVVRYDTYMVR